MKWLSKLFKKEHAEPAAEQTSMGLEELSELIDRDLGHTAEGFSPDLNRFYSRIQSAVDRLQEKKHLLSKAVPMEQVDFQLLKIASSHRDETVRKLDAMLKKFKSPISMDLDSFIEFHNSCVSDFNATDARLARSFIIFEQVFKQESHSLLSEYKEIYRLLEEVGSDLKEKKLTVSPIQEAKRRIETARSMVDELNKNSQQLKDLNSESSLMEEKAASLKKELETINSNEEWILFQRISNDKDFADGELKEVEMKIVQTVSQIARALKKYGSISDSSDRKLIESYLADNVGALLSDKNQAGIKDLVNRIEIAMSKKQIAIGGRREKGVMKAISEIKAGRLESLAREHGILQDKKRWLEARLGDIKIKNREKSLKLELNIVHAKIIDAENKIKKLSNAKAALYEELNKTKPVLEETAGNALARKL